MLSEMCLCVIISNYLFIFSRPVLLKSKWSLFLVNIWKGPTLLLYKFKNVTFSELVSKSSKAEGHKAKSLNLSEPLTWH